MARKVGQKQNAAIAKILEDASVYEVRALLACCVEGTSLRLVLLSDALAH